jgi:hypothetical protein
MVAKISNVSDLSMQGTNLSVAKGSGPADNSGGVGECQAKDR